MSDLEEYLQIEKKAKEAQREADKARASLDVEMENLKNNFKCNSIKEAKAELAKRRKIREVARKEFNKAKEEFEDKWKDRLDEK
jgi:archaellum component FlaD/FlaE